jgi:hypothetical protein
MLRALYMRRGSGFLCSSPLAAPGLDVIFSQPASRYHVLAVMVERER